MAEARRPATVSPPAPSVGPLVIHARCGKFSRTIFWTKYSEPRVGPVARAYCRRQLLANAAIQLDFNFV
jgi:hypothetical protein